MSSSISWRAYEYMHIPKSSDWYWGVVVITLALAGIAVLFGNIIFAILILVGSFALIVHAYKEPRLVDFELNEKGVKVAKIFYPYSTLESFSIDAHETEFGTFAKLLIKSKKVIMPLIVIPIAEVHIEDVREYLQIFLEEEEHRESLGEKILEALGF